MVGGTALALQIGHRRSIFKNEFNEKLFREELSYFDDIDYSEKIDYLEGFEVNDQVVKNTLKEISLHKSEH